jgi:hypothetical protein
MALDIVWEDEKGEMLEKCPSWFSCWDYVSSPDDLQDTCCLRFLDDYGDTTFNQIQIPILLAELESLLPKSKDAAARNSLESVIGFIQKAKGEVHTYIKFYGD